MKRIMAAGNSALLSELAAARALLAFDFDGTLAPIVAQRDEAQMRKVTARLFSRLCSLYPCAVISGRSRDDVIARLEGARVRRVIGNHGLETGKGTEQHREAMRRVLAPLRRALAGARGIEIEDKGGSLAVHFRRARRKRAARALIARATRSLDTPLRIVPGIEVVNVVPAGAPHKGDALLAVQAALRADSALYVGDDVTDEDVFGLQRRAGLVTVRVGTSRSSAATYCLRDQREIDALLEALILRRDSPAKSRRETR